MKLRLIALFCNVFMCPAFADPAQILDASARKEGDTWSFSVTIRHADSGWEHYADEWSVSAPDGTVLGSRKLAHPHEDEQPFTRSLSGIVVPETVSHVIIRAHDTVDGWSDQSFTIQLK